MECCLYIVDKDHTANMLLLNAMKTFLRYNANVQVFCISVKDNVFIREYEKIGACILYLEDYPEIIERLKLVNIYNKQNIANRSKFTFIRLFLPYISKLNSYEKILYMDVDTEVYGNVQPIFEQCTDEDFFVGFDESFAPHAARLKFLLQKNNIAFKPLYDPYINAGVIVINYSMKNRKELLDRIDMCFSIYDELKFEFMDQDIVNAFFHTRAVPREYISFPLGMPSLIYHFVGESKKYLLSKCTRKGKFGNAC